MKYCEHNVQQNKQTKKEKTQLHFHVELKLGYSTNRLTYQLKNILDNT